MGRRRTPALAAMFLLTWWPAAALSGQTGAEREGRVQRRAEPPSPAEVLGYEAGERFTDHAGIVRYMEALAEASPRVRIERYGQTPEGRPLIQVVIASESNYARLDEILARNRTLTDPALPETEAQRIAATNPLVVYFNYGIHGDEAGSSETAMWLAWDLARDAASVAGVLDSVIVVIDPAANPDGRDRYVHWYRQASGIEPNPNPNSREHWEPWPGSRSNHYLFDLNRDWAWATQPETRARLATWARWNPHVVVDFHEMAWTSSYFFFPATEPVNPIYPEHILKWGRYFGEANAARFDEIGELYYTGEGFDLFYPGYGDSWPSLLGAVGMTYEQAGGSRAGRVVERPDGSLLTLERRIENHRLTGAATLAAAAARRRELLLDFAASHRQIGDNASDVLLVPGADNHRVQALLDLLHALGIRVERATRSFQAAATPHTGFEPRREFQPGTLRVSPLQPRGRLALTLLQPETVLDAEYSYDVTAWSLPYAFGIEAHRAALLPDAGWEPVLPFADAAATTASRPAEVPNPYGYLLPPGLGSWPGVIRFVRDGGQAFVLEREFTLEGRRWPAGTVFLARGGAGSITDRVQRAGLQGIAVPVRTGLATDGPDLGTRYAYRIAMPRLGVLAGDGVSASSFGAHWFFLERTLGMPFDALPLDRIDEIRLEEYDVLVLPELEGPALDDSIVARLDDWVRRGGTLIAVGSGAHVAGPAIAGVMLREPQPDVEPDATASALRGREARQQDHWDDEVTGAILPVILDPAHPLAFGASPMPDGGTMFVLHRGGTVFEPHETLEAVAYFAYPLDKISGVISQWNLDRLADGAWLTTRRVGSGRVILFADDPLFRHFWYSTFQTYVNAIVVGPRL